MSGWFAILILLLLLLLLGRNLVMKMAVSGYGKLPLPPGTLGWPYIGETFQLYSQNPNVFFASKVKKYGSILKTHMLGCPCVMISSPEAAKFVLVTKANLFKPTFPASKERMLGKQAIFFHQGDYHVKLRKLVLRAFMPEAIKNHVSSINSIALDTLKSLHARQTTINTFQEMKTYTFNVALLSILGKDEVKYREDLKRCYYVLEKGYNSMPINLPGTLFHKSMKARKELADILAQIICKRRCDNNNNNNNNTSTSSNSTTNTSICSTNTSTSTTNTTTTNTTNTSTSTTNTSNNDNDNRNDDLLASLMGDKEGLSDGQIADNVIGVIFAARDTTASVLTWIIKYLAENPHVLQAVTEEQEAIMRCCRRRRREDMGEEEEAVLSWADTRKMPFTSRVIQETLRVASILSFTFREAVQDVEFQGYLIPKGWKVLPLFRNIHHSPDNFTDPEKFDPTRFEVAPKPNTFMPFGNGIHSCPGNELAKLEIFILLHHLTTKYRWKIIGPQNEIHHAPFALPQNGLPIKLSLLNPQ